MARFIPTGLGGMRTWFSLTMITIVTPAFVVEDPDLLVDVMSMAELEIFQRPGGTVEGNATDYGRDTWSR